jgi:hypothetical protein
MNSDGTGLTMLTDDPAYDSFPAWRPLAGLFTEDPKYVERLSEKG